jgi:hypothetical protein
MRRALARLFYALPVAALTAAGLLAFAPGCGPFCRDVQTRELEFSCEDGANRFTGEIHFDRPTTFRTFLEQQCIPQSPQSFVDEIVDSVDWSTEAVFVAVGPPNVDATRCVDDRSLERAQVCSDGLKVYFADLYGQSDFGCSGPRWTVAFAMNRQDLRAALEAGESAQ